MHVNLLIFLGGHYYSYIRHRDPAGEVRWYKFDDGDVSECRMGDDEDMKVGTKSSRETEDVKYIFI